MMNKLLAFLILAASTLFSANVDANENFLEKGITHYSYFYVTNNQALPAISQSYACILWNTDFALETKEVFLDSDDNCNIILEDKGVYLVTYTVTAQNFTNENFKFALLLNGELIPGSIYGSSTTISEGSDAIEQLHGQVIFKVTHKRSALQLVNNTAYEVDLVSISGGNGDSVTASIIVEKINNL
jgi:hypothetical protein